MWTIIDKKKVNSYLKEYPELSDDFEMYKLYEKDDNIILPRWFYKNYPSSHIRLVGKEKINPDKVDLKFKFDTFVLRPEQANVINIVKPLLAKQKFVNGVIKLRPGAGKTTACIYLASLIGNRTLFLVDNESLMNQWIKEIIEYTDLEAEDIGLIKQNLFGIDKPVCVGMVQTLLSKLKKDPKLIFDRLDKANFGFVSLDECHKSSSSEKYAKVSTLFRTPNIIGLSATPYKFGYQDILMKNVIGDMIYDSSVYELAPKVDFIFYESGLTSIRNLLSRFNDYTQKKAMYNKHIVKSKRYFEIITKHVKSDLESGHKVIIICWTKDQINQISDCLDLAGIKNRKYFGDSRTYEETDDVLVATYAYAGHGFNFKELSSIFLACPLAGKVSLIQTIGRILRECEGKVAPVVKDLVDLTFPTIFLPDLEKKKKILEAEFKCVFGEIREYTDGKD